MISRGASRFSRPRQNLTHRSSGSSFSTMLRENLPPNVALSRRFSCIHADTLPQRTRIRLSWRLRKSSQPFFRNPGKSGSWRPIHDISSNRTTVLRLSLMRSPRRWNASIHELGTTRAPMVCAQSRSPKFLNWSAFVCPFLGPSPSMTTNSVLLRRANSLNSVDLPIRRRPRHATRDAVGFCSKSRSDSSSLSRPKNLT